MTSKIASILDYSFPFLDPAVWDTDRKLFAYQKDFILRLIDTMRDTYDLKQPEAWVEDVVILGSLTTSKWLLSSDMDVHIRVNLDAFIASNMPGSTKEQAFEKLDLTRKEFDRAKILAPMTQHPIEFYFESVEFKPSNIALVGVYSMLQDVWLKEPIIFEADLDFEESKKDVVAQAEALAEELDGSLGKIRRDIQRVDELEAVIQAWGHDKQQLFYAKVEAKLQAIEAEILKDLQIKQDLVDARHADQNATSEIEIKFKWLARFGFFGILSNLKTLLEQTGGQVTTQELPLIEKIISQAGQVFEVNGVRMFQNPSMDQAKKIFANSKDLNVRYVIDPNTNDMFIWDAYNLHHMPAMEGLGIEWTQEVYDNFTGTISSDDDIESLFTFWQEGGGERKAASLKQATRRNLSHAYWVDPQGKIYTVRPNEYSKDLFTHSDWVVANQDLLKEQYGLTLDLNCWKTMQEMYTAGWARIGDSGASDSGYGITVGDLQHIPEGVNNALSQFYTGGDLLVEGEFDHRTVIVDDPFPDLQKAVNKALQQKRMGSIKEAFLKEAFGEPKETDTQIAIDFDGTIAKDKKFPDIGEPEEGVKEALSKIKEMGYTILIYTCRSKDAEALELVREWLDKHEIPYDDIFEGEKPFAKFYIDDRAIHFDNWNNVLEKVEKSEKKASLSIVADKIYTRDELERMNIDDLDRMAYGHASGEIIQLNPSQIRIQYPVDISNPEYKFEQKGMDWVKSVDFSEPVKVSIKQNGKFYLEDGHHRWFAAKKLGLPLMAEIEVKAKPIETILQRQEAQKTASLHVTARIANKYWIAPDGKEFAFSPSDSNIGGHLGWIPKNKDILKGYGIDLNTHGPYGHHAIADDMIKAGWTRVTTESDYDFAMEVADINNLPPYLDNFVAKNYYGGGVEIDDLEGNYQDISDPFPSLRKAIYQAKRLRQQQIAASLKIEAGYDHAYWLDPNGKIYQVRGADATGTDIDEGKADTHTGWVLKNLNMLQKDYGIDPRSISGTSLSLIELGWIKIGDAYGTDWGVTVNSLRSIPSSVDDLLAQFAPEGSEITVSTPGMWQNAVTFEWPVKSVQQAVNQALQQKRLQPVSKAFSKKEIVAKTSSNAWLMDPKGKLYPVVEDDHETTAQKLFHKSVYDLLPLGWTTIRTIGNNIAISVDKLNKIPRTVDDFLAKTNVNRIAIIPADMDLEGLPEPPQVDYEDAIEHGIQKAVNRDIMRMRNRPSLASLKQAKTKKVKQGDYSCLMALVPHDLAQEIVEWGVRNVPDEDLYLDEDGKLGRELESHITIKYGLLTNDAKDVRRSFNHDKPFHATLGKVRHFQPPELPFDVLTVEIISDDLEKANKKICDSFDCAKGLVSDEYHPHITIAYMKRDTAKEYIGSDIFDGKEVELDTVIFSPHKGNRTYFSISNDKESNFILEQINKFGEFLPSMAENAPTNRWQEAEGGDDVEIALQPDSVSDDTTSAEPCTTGKPRTKEIWRQFISMFQNPFSKKEEMTIESGQAEEWDSHYGDIWHVGDKVKDKKTGKIGIIKAITGDEVELEEVGHE